MSRTLSSTAISSTQSTESGEVWLILMIIDHASLTTPLYLVNNTEDVIVPAYLGDPEQTYTAYPFDVTFGQDTGETLPAVLLAFDNVDQLLIDTIRTISDSPDITIKLVLASQPEIVEIEISDLKLREIKYDAYTINGTLYADDILNQRWPKDNVTKAAGYLGLFR